MTLNTDLVALVDAVDELRVGGSPGKADGSGVDGLCLDVAGGDGGHWANERKRERDG